MFKRGGIKINWLSWKFRSSFLWNDKEVAAVFDIWFY